MPPRAGRDRGGRYYRAPYIGTADTGGAEPTGIAQNYFKGYRLRKGRLEPAKVEIPCRRNSLFAILDLGEIPAVAPHGTGCVAEEIIVINLIEDAKARLEMRSEE